MSEPEPTAAKRPRPVDGDDADDDDDKPLVAPRSTKREVVPGEQCPYLDTISRQNLDFDFDKCCSVSLSKVNVYVCLVCGAYFQGRGPGTHAHTHSVEEGHHIFMSLETGRVFCIPDNYEVVDRSLKDIQHVLNPLYTKAEIAQLGKLSWARTLDGSDYMPGLVGMNNMKRNDYLNVVLQALLRVEALRDFFLWPDNYRDCKSDLVRRFGEVVRKAWNPRAFKGQVSPHELLQAIIDKSNKVYTGDAEADPVAFCSWLLNTMHLDLTGGHRKRSSIITQCFQGQLEVTTLAGTGKAAERSEDLVEKVPFFMLSLDLPQARLFQDAMDRDIIPQVKQHGVCGVQVPIYELLRKFDGERVQEDVTGVGRRRLRVLKLPRYLLLSVTRFTKNRFFVEKNPTIVNFPARNLNLKGCIADLPPPPPGKPPPRYAYNLLASVSHVGDKRPEGVYKGFVHYAADNTWFEVQDLLIQETQPEAVVITEAYFQVYERHRGKGKV